MGLSEAKRTSQPLHLEQAAVDAIVIRISDAVAALLIETLRARGLLSPSGIAPRELDGNDLACGMALGSDAALRATAPRSGQDAGGLWTAQQVAAHYGVNAHFVYRHADELGCIRLGNGPCARLRFDPQAVRERWSTVGRLPDLKRKVRKGAPSRRSTRAGGNNRGHELLDFDRKP
jgi:hypothetical protein